MCHLLLLLPVLALPASWIWPLGVALPVYATAAGISVGVYALALKAWKAPLVNGTQALIGTTGRVVRVGARSVTLQLGGELWTADVEGAPTALVERAVVVGIDGLRLKARTAIRDEPFSTMKEKS